MPKPTASAAPDRAAVHIDAQIGAVEREIERRRTEYRAAVEAGTMGRDEAVAEFDAMRAVLQTLIAAESSALAISGELWPEPQWAGTGPDEAAPADPAEPPPSDIVDDDALAEKQRVRSEVRAMLQEVEAERESGACREDVLAPCDRLCESGAIPEAAVPAARAAAGYVARGSQVGFAIDKALREAREAAKGDRERSPSTVEQLTTPALQAAS